MTTPKQALHELITDGKWGWSSDLIRKTLEKHGSCPILEALYTILDQPPDYSHNFVRDVLRMTRSVDADVALYKNLAFPPPTNPAREIIHLWTDVDYRFSGTWDYDPWKYETIEEKS